MVGNFVSRAIYDKEFAEYRDAINSKIEELFPENYVIHAIARKAVSKGKRIRAMLSLLSCEACCGDYRPAIPLAVSYEIGHAAALVQDDIIDRANRRRGLPTVHTESGEVMAILVCDLLISETYTLLSQYKNFDLPEGAVYDILKIAGAASKATVIGEFLDLELARKDETTIEEYIEMVRNKTGALLAGPAACGAVVGRGTNEDIQLFYSIGENLGIAYQIFDDMLDIMGNPSKIGKPIFNNIIHGKKNILVLHLINNGSKQQLQSIYKLMGKEEPREEKINHAKGVFRQAGSIEYANKLAREYAEKARAGILQIPSEAGKKLLKLSDYLVSRFEY
ncbi:MAG: polyprenyl synthetase family protein [Thaumarchaeota archaeon]|nr:polyprenyl synthetase family protein [Nitrososphaerota archaeon]